MKRTEIWKVSSTDTIAHSGAPAPQTCASGTFRGRGTDGGAQAEAQRGRVLLGCGAGVQSWEEGLPPPDSDPHQVTGLSVTSGRDQLVVLHARGQDDLVVCLHRSQPPLDNRVGELVGVLAAHYQG